MDYVFASLVCVHAGVRLSVVFCTILSHLTLSAYSSLFHYIAHVCDLIPVHGIYHLFISDFEIRFLLFCVCAVAVWIKNITCANAHLLQSAKNSLILNLSSYRNVVFSLVCRFSTSLTICCRHLSFRYCTMVSAISIDKDANLYVWLRHEILMKYDVVIWVKYNYDSSWKTSFVSVRVNIMALWKRQ